MNNDERYTACKELQRAIVCYLLNWGKSPKQIASDWQEVVTLVKKMGVQISVDDLYQQVRNCHAMSMEGMDDAAWEFAMKMVPPVDPWFVQVWAALRKLTRFWRHGLPA